MLLGRRIRTLRRFGEMADWISWVASEWSRHGTSGIHGHLDSWLYRMDLDAGSKVRVRCNEVPHV
jgi:hypothetical protein